MDHPDLLSAGAEPRGAPARRPRLLPSAVRRRGSRVVLAFFALAVVVAAAVSWWSGAGRHAPALAVAVDPSEYFLPHPADAAGRSQVVLLLRVTGADLGDEHVELAALSGGGVTTAQSHALAAGSPARVAVRVTLACDAWASGSGVHATLRVTAPGAVTTEETALDLGPGTHLHAQLDEACSRWRDQRVSEDGRAPSGP